MKKLYVITLPDFISGESEILTLLFKEGLERLHLRKPGGSKEQLKQLIQQIPPVYHPRIVLHDCLGLANEFSVGGIHLNRRNPDIPAGLDRFKSISRSCHSLQEVEQMLPMCDYVFLSPVFSSISKEGYGSGFQLDTLYKEGLAGRINKKVIALGGMDIHTIPLLHTIPFGGVACLGAIWGNHLPAETIIENFKSIREILV